MIARGEALRVPDLDPGSPEWLATVSGSQVASIIGVNPYQSGYELWMLKSGKMPRPEATTAQTRGHEFEPLILRWLSEAHPDWTFEGTGTFAHPDRPWQTGNPDQLYRDDTGQLGIVEVKTDRDHPYRWRHGIPEYYQCQACWYADILGLDEVLFAVAGPYELVDRKPAEYRYEYDSDLAAFLRREAERFSESLALGIAPDPDHTRPGDRAAVRWQHTRIEETPPVELPAELAVPWLEALADEARWEGRKAEYASRIGAYLGDAKTAEYGGITIGTRRSGRGGGPPSFTAAKGIKDKAPQLITTEGATP